MGVVVTEQFVCDYCGKPISGKGTRGEAVVGRMTLHLMGAPGKARRCPELAFHPACEANLTRNARRPPARRRAPRANGRAAGTAARRTSRWTRT